MNAWSDRIAILRPNGAPLRLSLGLSLARGDRVSSKEEEAVPRLESWGGNYLERLPRPQMPEPSEDAVHVLSPAERAALRKIERTAITRSAVAGGLSSIVTAGAEIGAGSVFQTEVPRDQVIFWAIVIGTTVVASVIEIGYVYRDSLLAVHRLGLAAGLPFSKEEARHERYTVRAVMARAALELPNPNGRLLGVHPWREVSRTKLVFASLVYKLKTSASNFLAKVLLRRLMGRAILRAYIPFIAAPITAFWNGWVSWTVLREARIRAMGPSAARELILLALADMPDLPGEEKALAFRAVASAIVETADMHPNLVAMMRELHSKVGVLDVVDLDHTSRFLGAIAKASGNGQTLALRILAIACVLDGRLAGGEVRLFQAALRASGREVAIEPLRRLREQFVAGDEGMTETVLAIGKTFS